MQEATEYDANYWKTRHVLLEGKRKRLQEQRDELLEAIKELLAVSHNANIPDSEHIRHAPYKMIVVLKARAAIAKATGSEAT